MAVPTGMPLLLLYTRIAQLRMILMYSNGTDIKTILHTGRGIHLGCYACTPTIKVPDNREVRDNKRRDFRCSKSAMHEPDVGPGERSLRLPARSL